MKFIIALCLIGVTAVVAASADVIDWSKVKPLDVNPRSTPALYPKEDAKEGRITNGQLAEPKQFPYQAGLILYTAQGTYWCGGSVISDRWILTAAHCTESLSTGVDVYLGAWNRSDRTEKNQQIIFTGKKNVIVHEDWDGQTLTNDISLIKLPVRIEFNDYIKAVKLPKVSSAYPSYEGENAIASGWGQTSDQIPGVTEILRWIEVPIMSNNGCSQWYFGSVQPTNICIKTTGGYSTCSGDSGGPLVTTGGDEPILIGATSFGIIFGCEVGWPGVFTRIDSYLDWIEQHSGVVNK